MSEGKNIPDKTSEDESQKSELRGRQQEKKSEPVIEAQTSNLADQQAATEQGTSNDEVEPLTTNDKPETSTMEVHKHPHHITHKKKWGEYLLEFAMIFFAVFLGFLAENTREHIVERKKAKEFIESMVDDLKKDTANFQQTYLINEYTMQQMDSLILRLKAGDYNSQTSRLYYLARIILGLNQSFTSTDRTFNQMKSSGNLRLITNHEIADSVTSYYFKIDQLHFLRNSWLNAQDDYTKKISVVFDASIFQELHKEMREHSSKRLALPNSRGPLLMPEPPGNPALADNSAQSIAALVASTHFFYTRTYGMQSLALRARSSAADLIDLLQKHYHLPRDN